MKWQKGRPKKKKGWYLLQFVTGAVHPGLVYQEGVSGHYVLNVHGAEEELKLKGRKSLFDFIVRHYGPIRKPKDVKKDRSDRPTKRARIDPVSTRLDGPADRGQTQVQQGPGVHVEGKKEAES